MRIWQRFSKSNPNRRIVEEFEMLRTRDYGDCAASRPPNFLHGWSAWAKEFIASPHDMGAVIPSGPVLGMCMAQQVPATNNGVVIELGAGTGTMTHALLKRGIAKDRLIVIERSPLLAAHLARRFPDIKVVRGDAARLVKILNGIPQSVSAIVSSLPLHALPPDTVKEIVAQLNMICHHGTRYIQYTFHRSMDWSLNVNFRRVYTKFVWCNIPPARVEVYEYHKQNH
jgi:phosphatidylethanolamine/phosphatidyl-N-methylethanolamine N-methyltransferase